jgi:hypothetical protein
MAVDRKCLPKSLMSHRADRRVAGVLDPSSGVGRWQAPRRSSPRSAANRTFKSFGDDLKARSVQMSILAKAEQQSTSKIAEQTNNRPEKGRDQVVLAS